VRPGSRQIIGRTGIRADLPAHIPSAPGPGPADTAMVTVSGGIVVMMPCSIMMVVTGSVMMMGVP
jgi:hypothetical protein